MTVLASCWASSARTLRANSTGSPCARLVGTARTASVRGEKGVISSPSARSVSVLASQVATSCGVAANVAGIMAQPDVDGALVGGASLEVDEFGGICRFYDMPVLS